jgi:glycosyltransferase involved in cell wall biosynthesis
MGDDLLGTNSIDGSITCISKLLAKINSLLARRFYNQTIVKSMEMLTILNSPRSSLIPNGVDLNIFKPNEILIACNNLGFDCAVKNIIFVSDPSRVEKNFKLAVNAVTRLGLQNVRLLPVHGINHADLVNYYNAASVVVLTSLHEGSPNVIKEAMACNCPIVTTDVGDARWVIGKTDGCFIASFKTIEFSEKIMAALEFSQRGQCTNGRDRIVELGLDSRTIAKKIIDIYKTEIY